LTRVIFATYNPCSGIFQAASSDPATPSDYVLGYQLYSTGSEPKIGPLNDTLSTSVSNEITNGAGVNVPSESLGFYFSGYTAPDGSQISSGETLVAAESFIQVDMSSSQEAAWSTLTWPTGVKPRANAQLVWLPVSSQGVLIVIGGVVDSTQLAYGAYDNASQTADSLSTSPIFMTSLPVYDIGSQKWFVQNTSGHAPGQLTGFCSVVAEAAGSSTSEIFIYGGYDGLNGSAQGDVWVLSIPSFTWVHAYPGTDYLHARNFHVCVKPYPDQMFVIGGQSIGQSPDAPCVHGIIDVFNLSNVTWLESYDPLVYADYSIPSVVANSVSATSTSPSMDPSLSAVLASKYGKSIATYYPYPPMVTEAVTPTPGPASRSNLLPAILGAVLGVFGLSLVIFAIWWFSFRKGCRSVTSRTQPGGVDDWVDTVGKPDSSVTTTEVDDSRSPPPGGCYEAPGNWTYSQARSPQAAVPLVAAEVTQRPATSPRSPQVEADGIQRYEMHTLDQGSPQSAHVEADGSQRYEMHVMERSSPGAPTEMVTSYHFRDHSLYPWNLAGDGETMSLTHEASLTSGDASAPSPYVLPQRFVDTRDTISHPASNSPPLSSPDQSPPMPSTSQHTPSHKRNVSSMSSGLAVSQAETGGLDLDALEAVSGLGYSASRPANPRNPSSMSDCIAQLPESVVRRKQIPGRSAFREEEMRGR
jgi:hypothetical protein